MELVDHWLSHEHLCNTYGGKNGNFWFTFQSISEFKPSSFQSQVCLSKVKESLGENNHLFHSCLACSVWGCEERENRTCRVQGRERYTVKRKKMKLEISEASAFALLQVLIMKNLVFHLWHCVLVFGSVVLADFKSFSWKHCLCIKQS